MPVGLHVHITGIRRKGLSRPRSIEPEAQRGTTAPPPPRRRRTRSSCRTASTWWPCSEPGTSSSASIEKEFAADIHVRGNEITLTASPAELALVERLIDELIAVVRTGHGLTADAVERSIAMLRAGDGRAPGRRADAEHPVQPRPHHPAEDAEPEAVRRRDRQAHHRVRHRPGRYRQDLPGDGQGGAGAAGQAGQPDHPDPAGGRGRASGSASCPARCRRRSTRTCGRCTTPCTTCSTRSRSRG